MRRPNDTPRRILIVLVAVVLLSGLMPGRIVRGVAHIPSEFFRPLIVRPAQVLAQGMHDPSAVPELHPETDLGNDAFQKLELIEAEAINVYLRQRVAELERLVDNLGLIGGALKDTDYRVLPATAVRLQRDRQRPQLTVNRGEKDGVREGDVVVGDAQLQLVGVVAEVSRSAAQVDLIHNPKRSLRVQVVSPEASDQPLTPKELWVSWDPELKAFVTNEPARDFPVQPAYLAYARDEGWPDYARVFPIGQVAEVGPAPDAPDLRLQVVIRPLVQMSDISRVNVLVIDSAGQAGETP